LSLGRSLGEMLGSLGLGEALGSLGLGDALGSLGLGDALGSLGLGDALGSLGLGDALGSLGLGDALGSLGLGDALGSRGVLRMPGRGVVALAPVLGVKGGPALTLGAGVMLGLGVAVMFGGILGEDEVVVGTLGGAAAAEVVGGADGGLAAIRAFRRCRSNTGGSSNLMVIFSICTLTSSVSSLSVFLGLFRDTKGTGRDEVVEGLGGSPGVWGVEGRGEGEGATLSASELSESLTLLALDDLCLFLFFSFSSYLLGGFGFRPDKVSRRKAGLGDSFSSSSSEEDSSSLSSVFS